MDDFLEPPGAGLVTEAFVKCLSREDNSQNFLKLYAIFGNELYLFLTVFAGKRVQVPRIDVLRKKLEYVRIYTYVQGKINAGKPKEQAVEMAASHFKRRKDHVSSIFSRIGVLVEGFDNSSLADSGIDDSQADLREESRVDIEKVLDGD